MFELEIAQRINSKPQLIWELLANNTNFPKLAPAILETQTVSGKQKGMVRSMHHQSGLIWYEECTAWEEQKTLTMQFKDGNYPLPISYLSRTFDITKHKTGLTLKIRYTYTPIYGLLGWVIDRYQIRPQLSHFAYRLMHSIKAIAAEHRRNIQASAMSIMHSGELYTVSLTCTIRETCAVLAKNKIGNVLVLDKENKLAGVVSERDIVRGINDSGETILEQPVTKIMTAEVITADSTSSLAEITNSMGKHNIRHIPIMEQDKVIGMVSISDVIRARVIELEEESETMKQYIEARRWRDLSLQIGRGAAVKTLD